MAHPGPLPPLQKVPTIERLLAPGERVIYTAKLHPLFGWYWAVAGFLLMGLGYFWAPLALLGLPPLGVYWLAFRNNEVAVTTHRLLVRRGVGKIYLEAVLAEHIDDWRLKQSLLGQLLHMGTVSVGVHDASDTRALVFTYMWHPLSFLEALETLQSRLYEQPSKRAA
ncbi:MAG: PH domain-containing protein [Proteobacteria bacterium]|nr:PH domain-containing protein [Pseudomonadota bacterium]